MSLTPAPIPVLDILPTAFDYNGEARYFAVHWEPAGDEFRVGDGRVEYDGNWQAWLIYRDHVLIAPLLEGYNFGSSDGSAEHWLLFDRSKKRAYVAPVAEARKFLRAQWSDIDDTGPVRLTAEELQAFVEQFSQLVPTVKPEEIQAHMRAESEACEALQKTLDDLLATTKWN